jgi:hypothetical protein
LLARCRTIAISRCLFHYALACFGDKNDATFNRINIFLPFLILSRLLSRTFPIALALWRWWFCGMWRSSSLAVFFRSLFARRCFSLFRLLFLLRFVSFVLSSILDLVPPAHQALRSRYSGTTSLCSRLLHKIHLDILASEVCDVPNGYWIRGGVSGMESLAVSYQRDEGFPLEASM